MDLFWIMVPGGLANSILNVPALLQHKQQKDNLKDNLCAQKEFVKVFLKINKRNSVYSRSLV